MEKFHVLGQVEYQEILLKSSSMRLFELKRDLKEPIMAESRLRESSPIDEDLVTSVLKHIEELRKGIDSEKSVKRAFESLRGSGSSSLDSALQKLSCTEQRW